MRWITFSLVHLGLIMISSCLSSRKPIRHTKNINDDSRLLCGGNAARMESRQGKENRHLYSASESARASFSHGTTSSQPAVKLVLRPVRGMVARWPVREE